MDWSSAVSASSDLYRANIEPNRSHTHEERDTHAQNKTQRGVDAQRQWILSPFISLDFINVS